MPDLLNSSVIGRLLEELSWEGARIAGFRQGGRGRENVLTAEVLLSLDYLPRREFLGQVVAAARGADAARARLIEEIEDVRVTLLPDQTTLGSLGLVVQPDATLESRGTYVLVEAKRILPSAFQPEQLSREYLALMQHSGSKTPLLLLLLGSEPPVRVKGHGRLGLVEAIQLHLRSVHARIGTDSDVATLEQSVSERVAWITWAEVSRVVAERAGRLSDLEPSLAGTVQRLARSVTDAIQWHSPAVPLAAAAPEERSAS